MSASLKDNALALNSRTYTDDMFTGSTTTSSLSGEIGSMRGVAYYNGTRSLSGSGQWIGFYCRDVSSFTSSVGTSFSVRGYTRPSDGDSSGGGESSSESPEFKTYNSEEVA